MRTIKTWRRVGTGRGGGSRGSFAARNYDNRFLVRLALTGQRAPFPIAWCSPANGPALGRRATGDAVRGNATRKPPARSRPLRPVNAVAPEEVLA
jgi:hypothetical protein